MNDPARVRSSARPQTARFTIAQFYQIADSGALDDFARTELLDGRISVMNAQHMPHMRLKLAIYDALKASLGADSGLAVGMASIELGERNLPQPDIFVWQPSDAPRGAPEGSVKLVVEVVDTSERHDLGAKRRIYARHGIPEYWVAVLHTRRIERFAAADAKDYTRHESFGFADGVAALTLPGVAIPPQTLA